MKKLLYVITIFAGLSGTTSTLAKKSTELYEIIIANNTNMPMHWHMKTTGNDYNDEIQPGDAYVFHTSNLLLRLTITFKKGKKVQRRGYPIAGLQSGKDWIFGVSGQPFKEPWSVCGSWAHTKLQGDATLAAEIIGLAVGAVVVTAGAAETGFILAGSKLTGAQFIANLLIDSALLTAPEVAATAAGGAAGLGISGAAIGTAVGTSAKAFGLSRKMHKDKCKWYGK